MGFSFSEIHSVNLFLGWGWDILQAYHIVLLPHFFVMQAGTGIAELIALEISKKVSYTLVFICSIKLLVFFSYVKVTFFCVRL